MNSLKVLLVDDENDFLEVMSARIKEWGYEVINALSGEEAIGLLKENKPDVVVLDYMMPQMDGVATLKRIRKIDNKIPVIMFTVHPDLKVIKDADKLGIAAFIPKIGGQAEPKDILKSTLNIIERNLKK